MCTLSDLSLFVLVCARGGGGIWWFTYMTFHGSQTALGNLSLSTHKSSVVILQIRVWWCNNYIYHLLIDGYSGFLHYLAVTNGEDKTT